MHLCKGEVTDIDFIGLAGCEHEKQVESNCATHCCSESENKNESSADETDCCSTIQLNSSSNELLSSEKSEKAAKQLIAFVYTCYPFLLGSNDLISQVETYVPPLLSKNLLVDIQCFRI